MVHFRITSLVSSINWQGWDVIHGQAYWQGSSHASLAWVFEALVGFAKL